MAEKVCPVCNAMFGVQYVCPACGAMMVDNGAVTDFIGPYSPYSSHDGPGCSISQDSEGCVHLFFCPVCGRDMQKEIPTLKI